MPNDENVQSPVTLVAFGRSGTSLVSACFDRHSEFASAGETASLVFGTWHAAESAVPLIPPAVEGGEWIPADEMAARAVRRVLTTLVPSDAPRWFQKPIGLPSYIQPKFGYDWDAAASWYWKVMRSSFPKAKYFTVLRHPCDVVLSACSYWGYDQSSVWWSYAYLSYILAHAASPVEYAVRYEELVEDPEAALRGLCAYVDAPFEEAMLEACSEIHAPVKGREALNRSEISRRAAWDGLNPASADPVFVGSVLDLFARFGEEPEMPPGFGRGAVALVASEEGPQSDEEDNEAIIARFMGVIEALNVKIEALNLERATLLQSERAADQRARRASEALEEQTRCYEARAAAEREEQAADMLEAHAKLEELRGVIAELEARRGLLLRGLSRLAKWGRGEQPSRVE